MARPKVEASAELAWRVADQIGQAYSQMLALSHAGLADETITTAEFVALVILTMVPEGLTQTAWGQHQGVSRQRAHTIAGKLAAAKLVRQQKAGRTSTITPTARGRATVERLRPRLATAYAQELSGLSKAEAEELSRLLAKLVGHHANPDSTPLDRCQ